MIMELDWVEFNLDWNHKNDFKMDSHKHSAQAWFGITRRPQLDPFRCIAPAGLLKIAEPEMP